MARMFTSSCISRYLVACSSAAAPIPTPALLTSTSRRPKASRWWATRAHGLLVRQVGGDMLDVRALTAQGVRRLLERVGLASGEGEPIALLRQRRGECEADAARGSGDDGGELWHAAALCQTR